MPIKSVKLPIFIPLTNKDSYEKIFLPFLRNADLLEKRSFSLGYRWIIESKESLIHFLNLGGKIRLLIDLAVTEADYGLISGNDELAIETILRRELLDPLKRDIPFHEQWAIRYLYHLIDQGLIDLRIGIKPMTLPLHDAVIFLSEKQDTILFHGGFFEPITMTLMNVFVSWDQRDNLRINAHRQMFETEWKNKDHQTLTLTLPKTLKAEIKEGKDSYNPYQYLLENKQKYRMKPAQQDSIDRLAKCGWKGIYCLPIESNQMLLSVFAIDQFILTEPRTVALIVLANRHALCDWEGFVRTKYPDKPIYSFANAEEARNSNLSDKIRIKLKEDFIVVITTYTVFADQGFQTLLRRNKNTSFFVFDECLLMARQVIMNSIKLADNSARLGFSSTPIRWLSPSKESYLTETIGTVLEEVPLADVLGKTLDEYHYHVHLSELIVSEYSQFKQLTYLAQTASAAHESEKADLYLEQREQVLEMAHNKMEDFVQYFSLQSQKRAVVYVEKQQIDLTLERFQFEFGMKAEALKPGMSMTHRNRILKSFLADQIDILITTEAFNEGIDSLQPKAIYLLSTPSSPRVFFQRRNSLLTSQVDKRKPIIHDFVTIAPREGLQDAKQKDIVLRELSRVIELSRLAAKTDLSELLAYLESLKLRERLDTPDPSLLNREHFVKDEPFLE